jgi:hypothetical protein
MKRYLFCFLLFGCLWLHEVKAQDSIKIRPISISVGIGWSPGFTGSLFGPDAYTNMYYDASYEVQNRINYKASFTSNVPHLDFFTDYRISRYFSLGVAASYEDETITQYWGYGVSNPNCSDLVSRTNVSGRILKHIKPQMANVFDAYIGLRIGASYWTDVSTLAPGVNPQNSLITSFLTPTTQLATSVQFLFGISTGSTEPLSFHFEAAIGSPYFLEVGFNFRFGKKIIIAPARGAIAK